MKDSRFFQRALVQLRSWLGNIKNLKGFTQRERQRRTSSFLAKALTIKTKGLDRLLFGKPRSQPSSFSAEEVIRKQQKNKHTKKWQENKNPGETPRGLFRAAEQSKENTKLEEVENKKLEEVEMRKIKNMKNSCDIVNYLCL